MRKSTTPAQTCSLCFLGRRVHPPFHVVRLQAEAGRLRLTVTDRTTQLQAWTLCEGNDLDVRLPARPLFEFVGAADRDVLIEFVVDGSQVDVAFELCPSTFETLRDSAPQTDAAREGAP